MSHPRNIIGQLTATLATVLLLASVALAQGTRTWEQSRYDELVKGTARGVAIRSDGSLELAPASRALYTTPSTYVWSIAGDDLGNVYAAAGAPSRVYRITPQGQATVIFAPQELQVQALAIDRSGVIYAATSPDGKVYRIAPVVPPTAKPGAKAAPAPPMPQATVADALQPKVTIDPTYTSSVFFEPKTKYIWALALDAEGRLYVATGDRGEIFRIDRNGTSSVFFKSDEAHIRAITFDQKGNLIAGSDGSGLVYRISPAGEGFVLYSAPKKEITALAIDTEGNIYAVGAGEKRPVTPTVGAGFNVPVMTPPPQGAQSALQPGAAPFLSIPLPGMGATGSEVYRIAPDGSPKRIWSSRDNLAYALGFDHSGRLIAGTGNKGRVYAIDGNGQFTDLLKLSASQVVGFARAANGAMYAATSNLGKIFVLEDSEQREATYESDIFDARNFSRWGRIELRSTGNVELFARSGNVDNPDRNWSPWRKVDTQKDSAADSPAARFLQWRVVLHSGNPAPRVDSVRVNYLAKNVAPELDDVSVQVGYRFQSVPRATSQMSNVADNVPQQSQQANAPAIRDHNSIAVRWNARDDNDDQLTYSLYYRGDGESRWKLLKDDLGDRFYTFDAALLPDGGYTIRAIASDAPSHSPDEALTASRESARFEVDSTPPRVENLAATLDGNELHITFSGADSFSLIRRAEFSVDAGEWRYVAPIGEISDSLVENYDLTTPLPTVTPNEASEDSKNPQQPADKQLSKRRSKRPPQTQPPAGTEEHVVVVRVYDSFDNMGSAKVIVKPLSGASSQ
ncbi:MAG TPA: hypothetical protein VN622_03010 [Clostridia bacterium]|nr:hypothetical protein [Clostridia bacterium]